LRNASPVPAGFTTVTPYLVINPAAKAIDFYRRAFDAVETFRLEAAEGRIVHAEIRIGDAHIMLTDGSRDFPFMQTASDLGGSPIQIYLYLPDADSVFQRALDAGAEEIMAVADNPDGDRRGGVRDPFGIVWWIATATDPDARERMMNHQMGQSD
jgi:PhnB protein